MKKLLLMVLFVVSLLGLGITSIASDMPTSLVIHYYRPDNDYTSFNMWVWEYLPTSQGGIQHDFDPLQTDANGVYYSIDIEQYYSGATTLGIIIKQGAWGGYQEPGGDRYIDLTTIPVTNGVANAYFIQGATGIGYSANDIMEARFNTSGNINVISISLATSYTLYEDNVAIATGTPTSTNFTISLGTYDLSKSYKVSLTFADQTTNERNVSIDALYDTAQFKDNYTYTGTLGVSHENEYTVFRLWAPLSQSVTLNLYNQGHPNYNDQGQPNDELTPYQTIPLYKIEDGAWEVKLTDNLDFKYYTYSVDNNGVSREVVDPYAYSTGANGLRGMIVNFDDLNPDGWTYNSRPNTITNLTDYIIYELHVRDLTTHSSWHGTESYRGKFMGFTESGTTYSNGTVTVKTGLDHLAELGITAVQLLPIFDFGYVDEVQQYLNPNYANSFNWGYMPYNFNTLEGSYSTNPFDGRVRINEFKQLVMALSEKDIRIIMDVVYNHTGESSGSNFEQIVPGYYHRMTSTGAFSNGSGTGNETASERPMMRKFMVDSVHFWATEYNLSGFRFDLMALHDVDTMNAIQADLEAIDPTMIVYGEPWTGGTTTLSSSISANKDNIQNMHLVGAFNDVTRDAIKGSVFTASEKGWVQGNATTDTVQGIMYGIVGGIDFPGITSVNAWHLNPNQTINYVSAHDNNTLYDKLKLTGVSTANIADEQIQANAIILTSQGIPFLHAGVDFMRSKPTATGGFDSNSYESPDSVNQLRWDRKAQYINVFEYYKALIEIRKTYSHFRMTSANEILARLQFVDAHSGSQAIAYKIDGNTGEPDIYVIHSGNPTGGLATVDLDAGKTYSLLTYTDQTDLNGIETISGTAFVPAHTSAILVENVDPSVTINQPTVEINQGQAFDPSSNVTINNDQAMVYYSNYFDVNVPGRYTVTVAVVETYGGVHMYYYTLYVKNNLYNVTVDESLIGG